MPYIRFHITDETGAAYSDSESAVFIPGGIAINEDYADNNNCVYISSTKYNSFKNMLATSDDSAEQLGTIQFIEGCLSHNLGVLYCYVKDYGKKKKTCTVTKTAYDNGGEDLEQALEALEETKDTITLPWVISYVPDDEKNPTEYTAKYTTKIDFLQDKDNYDVKFLTSGYINAIDATIEAEGAILQDSNDSVDIAWQFETAKELCNAASARVDCAAILGVNYNTEKIKNGDIFVAKLKEAIPKNYVPNDASFSAIYVPNRVIAGSTQLVMPSTWAYLVKYGEALNRGQEWFAIANSARGNVESLGKADLTITKYYMDTNIIDDTTGVSFNAMVNLRPYGSTIWGDRTLLTLSGSVKALGYLSLRLLICDVVKRAYQAAVRNTYESNNDITWFNFKSRITSLLGEMVASGVLSNYNISKVTPSSTTADNTAVALNTITCRITLYPNLPVENFDIYINLENAEVSVS